MSTSEEEYFNRLDAEKKAQKQAIDEAVAAAAAEERRRLYHNRCGRCGDMMVAQIFKGVEIDQCPESRGAVLLDPGELQTLAGEDDSSIIRSVVEILGFSR